MSSIKSHIANQVVRQFVSAAPFQNDLFSYTTTTNPTTNVTTGALNAPITGATASSCPAGRILRDNGLRLYPGVNPIVNTYMIGVYDSVSLLSGYIDPNSPVFAVYSTQLPAFYDNGVDPGPQGLPDEGPPVYTNGNIISVSGDIVTETGSITAANGIVATTGQIRAAAVTALTSLSGSGGLASQSIDPTLGEIFTISSTVGGGSTITLNATSAAAGSKITLIITTSTAQNTVFTFGTNMFSAGTLTTNGTSGKYSISFISNGTDFYETARTATQA
jgi:hypothetical protein